MQDGSLAGVVGLCTPKVVVNNLKRVCVWRGEAVYEGDNEYSWQRSE